MDVLFVHGYNVTSTKTYGVLPQRVKKAGHRVRDVYLSKYVTLDDDLTLRDLVNAFQSALEDTYGESLGRSRFACVTHSTGGFLLRAWISSFHEKRMSACPISHLIMLAPPNFGSRLASLGKSRLSRFRSLGGIEPGVKLLNALDAGSVEQWEVNTRWLENGTATAKDFYPFVIAGQWIDKRIWDVIVPATYEKGSDGVVRAASANLNFRKLSLSQPKKVRMQEISEIPFLIAPKTSHSDERFGLMGSVPSRGDHPVLTAILRALNVSSRSTHKKLAREFKEQSEAVQRTEPYYDGTMLDRYCQLVVRVTDQDGNSIPEYAIELVDSEGRGDRFPRGFLSHSYQNPINPEMFVFYLNYDRISQVRGGQVGVRLHSVPGSPLVMFERGFFIGKAATMDRVLVPNQTTYLDFVLRRSLNKNVFRLTKSLRYQKITRKAGRQWFA